MDETISTPSASPSAIRTANAWTRLTHSVQNTATTNRAYSLYVNSRKNLSSDATLTTYWDDAVIYTSTSSTTDIADPSPPTSLTTGTVTSQSIQINWANGSDAGEGVGATYVLRTTNTNETSVSLNDQAQYSASGGSQGPRLIGNWEVVSASVSPTDTSFTDNLVLPATSYKYAVVHLDKALNYSTALVSSAITSSPAPTITVGTVTAFSSTYGTASPAQSVSVLGSNLTSAIIATAGIAPDDIYEVATTQNGPYGSSVSYVPSGGSVSGTLWIRLKANAPAGSYYPWAVVSLSSGGGASATISHPSPEPYTVIAKATPTLSITSATFGAVGSPVTLATSSSAASAQVPASAGEITYTSSNPNVVSISGNSSSGYTATPNLPGTATITATQTEDGNYNSAVATQSFTVNPTSTSLRIARIYYNNGLGKAFSNPFVEIYNTSDVEIDITNYYISIEQGGGSWAALLSSTSASKMVKAKGYWLVQYGNATSLPVQADSIITVRPDIPAQAAVSILTQLNGGGYVDSVDFGKSSPNELSSNATDQAIFRKRNGPSWQDSTPLMISSLDTTSVRSVSTDFYLGDPANPGLRNRSYSDPPSIAITGAATTTAFATTYGSASLAQSFSVSGDFLTADLVATAPAGFEVSNNGISYGGTATFTRSGTAAAGTLYIRLAGNAAVGGSYDSKNIVLSSTGAASVNITTASSGNAVTARALTITANNDSKTFGQTKSYGSGSTAFTSSGLQNGETIGSVTITASGGGAAADNVNTYNLTPSAATGGTFLAANYSITYNAGTLTVTKASQTITFGSLAEKVVGDAAFNLTATAGSGLAVSYTSSDTGVATISSNTVTVVGKGTTTITASQAGNSNWNAAANVPQALTVKSRFAAWSGTETMTTQSVGLYAIGGASNSSAAPSRPTSGVSGGNLTLTAIVRTNDPKLAVVGEASTNFTSWTNTVTSSNSADTNGVPSNHARKIFSVPQSTDGKKFLRLKAILTP